MGIHDNKFKPCWKKKHRNKKENTGNYSMRDCLHLSFSLTTFNEDVEHLWHSVSFTAVDRFFLLFFAAQDGDNVGLHYHGLNW